MSETETDVWQRARRSRRLELVAAIVAGTGLIAMLVVFYTILSKGP